MRAIRRSVAALLVLVLAAGLMPVPALAYYVERVCDPDGYCYRRIVHDDGTVTTLSDGYSSYYSSTYTPRYYSSSYDPYYYDSPYYGGYYRRSGVGTALGAAALGYAVGRGFRHR